MTERTQGRGNGFAGNGLRGGFGSGEGLFEFGEEFGGAAEGADGGIAAAGEKFEVIFAANGGEGERALGVVLFGFFHFAIPELGFEALETGEEPSAADEGDDERVFDGVGGAVGIVEFVDESFEGGRVLAGND